MTNPLFKMPTFDEPIDEFLNKRRHRLQDIPEKAKKKLLEDAKFFARHELPLELEVEEEQDVKEANGLYGIPVAMETAAYPNYDYQMHRDPPADTRKWLEAVQAMYYLIHKGEDKGQALIKTVAKWTDREKRDFNYWLRFYEEGAYAKYKAGYQSPKLTTEAQMQFFENHNQLGYMPTQMTPGFEQMRAPETHPDVQEDERRERIEIQRSKELSRLDSFEKLLRSHEGHELHGAELEAVLDSAHLLKRQIITVNKRSLSTRIYEDMIVREANALAQKGFRKSAALLQKVAQAMPDPPEANNPLQGGGIPGNMPGEGPGLTPQSGITGNDSAAPTDPSGQAMPNGQVGSPTALPLAPPVAGQTQSLPPANDNGQTQSLPPANDNAKPPPSVGMAEFLKSLEDGNNVFEDEDDEPKELKEMVAAASLTLGLKYQAALVLEHLILNNGFIKEAQGLPVVEEPAPEIPATIEVPEEEQVDPETVRALTDEEAPQLTEETDPEAAAATSFDKVIDTAFQQLTIADVVAKLEDLTKVFKVREIPRQLSIVDMMLDRLGLVSFFPSLGECVQKSHESNNYISTRVEDILSRLRGTLEMKSLNLGGKPTPVSPELQAVHNKLQNDENQAGARKKMRKELSNRELDQANKPTPTLEMGEDLGTPPPEAPKGPQLQPDNLRLNRPR